MSTYELAGKVLLITGAARGIGFETARIAHGRGASVVLVDLDQASADEAAAKLGSRALALAADVVDLEAMEQAVSDSVDHFGKVDVVIANAGITPLKTTARAIDADDWEKVVEVNVMGVWRTIRAGLPEIKKNGGQAVIISSSYAHVNGIFNSSYAVSKAAVEALGRALQIELAPYGASATIAYFGYVETDLVSKVFDNAAADRFRDEMVPGFLTKPIKVGKAAGALVEGIENRSLRVIEPSIWKVPFYMRGLFGPLSDRRLERDERIPGFVAEFEADNNSSGRTFEAPGYAGHGIGTDYPLKGKVVVITGGARGIGYATAKAAYAQGAMVAVLDLDLEEAQEASHSIGPQSIGLAADATSTEQIEAAYEAVRKRFGRIDVVVANAGIAPSISTVATLPVDEWEKVVEVNLFGVWRTARAAIDDVIANQGQIFVVSSSYAYSNGVFSSPYATAKAGVEALGRSLRAELAPFGASAGVLYFGWVKTDMVKDAFADETANRFRTEVLPKFLTRQVPADKAGEKVVEGMTRRAATVIYPFEWRVLWALRGIVGPATEKKLIGEEKTMGLIRDLEDSSAG